MVRTYHFLQLFGVMTLFSTRFSLKNKVCEHWFQHFTWVKTYLFFHLHCLFKQHVTFFFLEKSNSKPIWFDHQNYRLQLLTVPLKSTDRVIVKVWLSVAGGGSQNHHQLFGCHFSLRGSSSDCLTQRLPELQVIILAWWRLCPLIYHNFLLNIVVPLIWCELWGQ